jgi:ubiquinone/menaquinone biosynthesis C-methylase UbiE
VSEIERIREVYEKRTRKGKSKLYSYFNTANLYFTQRRERALLRLLRRHEFDDLEDRKILDVGCGAGGLLRRFVEYGAKPSNLFGVDVLPERVSLAEELSPHIGFCLGNAAQLPFDAELYDIVMQFTLFTSVLDDNIRQQIATEMLRVLKPDGVIIWYDYHVNNPKNPDVRAVKKKELCELFQGCDIRLKRITLAPPIARMLAPCSIILCQLLEKLPFLCTHYIGAIRKK